MRGHRLIKWLISVLLLAGAGIAGYTLARGEPPLREQAEPTEAVAYKYEGEFISQKATVRWQYVYEMCGHTDIVEGPVDKTLIGLSFTQLQAKYPDARIVDFRSDEVVLQQTFVCYCPEHYLLKKDGEELAIYRTKEGTDEQRVYRLIHLSFNSIEAGERVVLTAGRVFDTLQDAESYITEVLGDNTQ